MADIHVVGCARQQRATAITATDLYTSDLVVKARAYVEAVGGAWFNLSARLHSKQIGRQAP